MANPTLTPQEYAAIQDANKAKPKPKEVVKYITKELPQKLSTFFESLAYLIIVFLYFFFTGMAILFKRKLPDFWVSLAKDIEGGRMVAKIESVKKAVELKKRASKARIVDLETSKDLNL